MSAFVFFDGGRWLCLTDGAVSARGDAAQDPPIIAETDTVVAVVPAREVTVTSIELPDLSDAQARAAARMALGETSLTTADTLHVAVGDADGLGRRSVVAVDGNLIAERLRLLAEAGLDPDHLLAAPMLLARPELGFVRGDVNDEIVVRGADAAFIDDPALTPLFVGAAPLVILDVPSLEAGLIAAIAKPEADLRQGIFAKRRRWAIDVARVRRAAVFALAVGGLVLTTQIVDIVRINDTAATLESTNATAAAALLLPGAVVTDPAMQAEARLSAIAGANGGFGPLAAAFATVVSATPNVEFGSLVFDGETGLRATVRGTTPTDLSAIEVKLAAAGLAPNSAPIVANQGRPYRDIVVRAR